MQNGTGEVDTHQVLKVVFKLGIGGLSGMTNLEREWRVGRHLALLAEPGKALPGFMQTGAAVVTDSGQFRGDSISVTQQQCDMQMCCTHPLNTHRASSSFCVQQAH